MIFRDAQRASAHIGGARWRRLSMGSAARGPGDRLWSYGRSTGWMRSRILHAAGAPITPTGVSGTSGLGRAKSTHGAARPRPRALFATPRAAGKLWLSGQALKGDKA